MSQNSKISKEKSFSAAKAVLAVLWQVKSSGKDNLFSHKYLKQLCPAKNPTTYRSCISRLSKKKYIFKDYNNTFILSDRGSEAALLSFIEAEARFIQKDAQKWDGGWRMVFFDIPEKKRKYRDYLRKILKLIGFREFQKSIWVYPYPVPSFLKDLILNENIKSHIKFVTTKFIGGDGDLRRLFNLR